MQTDVLIIGGGASGTAAAIQAARLGVKVVLVEQTSWLGGMITAAGVSAFDGNHNLPSGIWAEFREHIYKRYGGPNKVATGWVSNTLFEPHVGDSIFKYMVSQEKNITVLYNTKFTNVLIKNSQVIGANFLNVRRLKESQRFTITAKQIIDATELGNVMLAAKIPFDIGLEASKEIGEAAKVPFTKPIIQDFTYVAILKDYGNQDKTIAKPNNYDPLEFDGCCNEFCSKPEKLTSNVTAKKMLEYGKL
ncbi:MAG: FAD-dependent oxidoreductase, partial [Chitinophagaceae bacterium]